MLWTRKVHLGVPTRTRAYWDRARIRAVRAVATVLARGGRSAYEDDSERQAQVHFEDQWIDAPFACHDNRSDSPIDLVEQGDIEIEQASHRSHYAGQHGPV